MHQLNMELLPTQCPPGEALRIYLHRTLNFIAILVVAVTPFNFLVLYFRYETFDKAGVVNFFWFLILAYLVLSGVFGYFAWSLRGTEGAIRESIILDKMIDEVKQRHTILQEQHTKISQWLSESMKFMLTVEKRPSGEAELIQSEMAVLKQELEIYTGLADQFLKDYAAFDSLLTALENRIARFNLATGHLHQRVARLRAQLRLLEMSFSKFDETIRLLRERFFLDNVSGSKPSPLGR